MKTDVHYRQMSELNSPMNTTASAYRPVRIARIRQETRDVKTFFLEPEFPLSYKAGQFITFAFSHITGDIEHRSYSFSSSPDTDPFLSITVKRVENGAFSRPLFDTAQEGDVLNMVATGGFFVLPDALQHVGQVMLWAAGVGITPVFSLLKTLLATTTLPVTLLYSNRSVGDAVFYEELKALEATHPDRFHMVILLSDARNLLRARLHKGLLPQLLSEQGKVPAAQQLHYVCGPFEYRRMVIWALEEAGIPSTRIRREAFQDLPVRVRPEPPDKTDHTVQVQTSSGLQSIAVQYPDTILQAAKKQGMALPYSCETGRCGACAALCREGEVWMSYNEVLTDDDLAKGLVLTCTGHPQNGDVTLSF